MSDDLAMEWWEQRRLKYNVGLVVAGLLVFVCYVFAADRVITTGAASPEAEITLFTTAFQAIGYLFMMGVANGCYFAGAFVENHFVRQANVSRYRRIAFPLGFWFSVLLPFTIPVLVWMSPQR